MNNKNKLIISVGIIIIFLLAFNTEYLISVSKSKIINSAVEEIPSTVPLNTYPIIFLHGYNPIYSERISEYSLKEMQSQLSFDLGYRNKGLITDKTTCAELSYSNSPITVRSTYFDSFKVQEIDDYSTSVATIISRVIECTGTNKVDIITHSMGGIVMRNYLHNIDNSTVRKLIMLGTPNQGGLYNIGELANLPKNNSKYNFDFMQLSEEHYFLKSLNKENEIKNIDYYTIAGNKDGKGDGLVLVESVALENAKNYIVPCGHIALRKPILCPKSYKIVKDIFLEVDS